MADKHLTQSPAGEFVMFASDDDEVRVECRFEQETLWLPQATIANLYQVTPQAITQHIKASYEEVEFEQNATCKSYLQVQQEGGRQVSRNILHYSLPLIWPPHYRTASEFTPPLICLPSPLCQSQRYPFWFVKWNAHK